MGKYRDLTGQRFGRLTCIRDIGRNARGQAMWLCRCDCGQEVVVVGTWLTSGNTRSCGCLFREMVRKRNTKHGMCQRGKRTRLYGIWVRMRQRCSDPNCTDYRNYGGRGIRVCEEWQEFRRFYEWAMANGYRDGLTIDRIDPNGHYEPSNCRWVPRAAQARNTRANHWITFNGQTKTLAEWSEITGIQASTIRQRLRLGWSVEKALTTPVRGHRNATDSLAS